MNELSTGVRTVIARMETNPEEFFGEAHKWRFIFKETFREVMTEPEKAALHAALKEVRRKEFDALAVKTLLEDEMRERVMEGARGQMYIGQNLALSTGNYSPAMTLDSSGTLSIGKQNPQASLMVEKESLTAEDIRFLKEAASSTSKFK